MSLNCKLRVNRLPYLRFSTDMEMSELVEFVGDHGAVCFDAGDVVLAYGGPYDESDTIVLEDDDVLVQITGDLEVYSAEAFAEHFE